MLAGRLYTVELLAMGYRQNSSLPLAATVAHNLMGQLYCFSFVFILLAFAGLLGRRLYVVVKIHQAVSDEYVQVTVVNEIRASYAGF